jgi:hypothetical protein
LRQRFLDAHAWSQAGALGGGSVTAEDMMVAGNGEEREADLEELVGRRVSKRRVRPNPKVNRPEWLTE